MKLGIMQPYFFPYIGYFSLICNVDTFILLDSVQFIRHGWIERNRILKQTGGWQYISVPLEKHTQKTLIKDIYIDNEKAWQERLLAQIAHYRKAPYYYPVQKLLKNVLSDSYERITFLNKRCLDEVCAYLDIPVSIQVFSEMDLEISPVLEPDDWALNICRAYPGADEYWNPRGGSGLFHREKYADCGIRLRFHEVQPVFYQQKGNPFEPSLSIIDVLMFNSASEIRNMLGRYRLYE